MKINKLIPIVPLLACLAGCGHDPGYQLSDFNFPQTADIQMVNLMPDSPTIASTVTRSSDNALATQNAEPFAGASTQTSLIVGTYNLAVTYLDGNGNLRYLLNDNSLNYTDKDQFVYLFMGSVTNPVEQTIHFTDPFYTGGISSNDVEVWFADGASSPDQVDIYLTAPSTPIAAATPTQTLTTEGYSQPITIPNQTAWRLRVTPRGSTNVLFDSGSFALSGGARTLLAVTDYFGPTGAKPGSSKVLLNAIKVTSSGSSDFTAGNLPSDLRIIDLVRDLPPLDVYFGSTTGSPYASNVAELTPTAYQNIVPGSYTLNVTEHGIKDQFVLQQNQTFASGKYYTLVLTGSYNGGGTNSTISSVLFSTDPRPIQGRSNVNFINAGKVNGGVNVYLLSPGQTITGTTPQISDATTDALNSITTFSGENDVVVTSTNNKNIIIGPKRMIFNQGTTYTLVMVEDTVNQATQAKLLVLSDTPGA